MTEPVQTPRVLSGRYELAHLIARGGMAEVYRARDRLLDRPVALKILFPELSVDRSFVERFRREAQAAANLSHPNIVPVFDWGEDAGTYFIVMEYIDGRTLSSILRTAGALHPDRAAEIAAEVASALSYAHRHGVIHRDVKPGNVLITEEGVVKVTDFGIARALNTEESLTQTGAVMGTATYFSPEQAEGLGVDARSDIYSLGVVLFEMVTGRPPFLGETPVSVASKHVREHPPTPREINPSVPADLEAIILKCMAKAPEHRYPTGDDLRVDLVRFREGRSVAATLPPMGATATLATVGTTASVPQVVPLPEPEEERRNRTGLYVALLMLLLAALAVVVIFLGQSLGWWHLPSSGPPTFTLPDVYGQSVSSAESTLKAHGLNVTLQKDATSTAPTTVVVRTVPARGTSVHKGQTVVVVSGGKTVVTQITVPSNLVGQSVNAAQSELRAMGLQSTVQNESTCTQLNIVCDTSPKGGVKVAPNALVTLFTASQVTTTTVSPNTTVPAVASDSVGAACNQLGLAGLNCGSQITQYSSTITEGNVIATQPGAGVSVARGSTVVLIVSNGPPPVVPDVTGDTYGHARTVLSSQGLTGVSDGTCAANDDVVTAESPSAGSTAPNSGEVTLSCSGTAPTTTTTGGTGALGQQRTGPTSASTSPSPQIRDPRNG